MVFNKVLRKEDGSITIWFIFTFFILLMVSISLFQVFQLLYYRHAVDAAVEAAALCGASNVVETTDYINNTSKISLNKEKADTEANWLFLENIKKNGLSNAFEIKEFETKVETDEDNSQWYKCRAIVRMKIDGMFNIDLQYESISKGEFNKKAIQK